MTHINPPSLALKSWEARANRVTCQFLSLYFLSLYFLSCVHAKSLQSCPTLFDLMDGSPPGSSVHGILQTRTLERVVMSSSRGSSRPSDQTRISYVSCIGTTTSVTWEAPYFLSSDPKTSIPQEPPGWLFWWRRQQWVSRVDHCLGRCPLHPSSIEMKGTSSPASCPLAARALG